MKLVALALLPLCLTAAESASDRGRRVVNEALAALGGDKFLEMKDRVETGRAYSFYRDQLSGLAIAKIYTRYLDRPAAGQLAVRERQVFGKEEDQAVLFMPDGAGWEVTFRGARPLPDERVERYRDTTTHNVFYILRNRLREPGLIIEGRGSEVVANMPVEVVDFTDSENRITTVYFHRSTKLPVRQTFSRRLKTRERDEEVTVFSKYRDIGGGVQWPYAIHRERNGEKIYEMYADTVTVNQGVPDNYFELPSDAKKLKRMN